MPGFDGTGPLGMGPMTGRGMGYCAFKVQRFYNLNPYYGYLGLQGVPVSYPFPMNICYFPYRRSCRSARYAHRRFGRGRHFIGYYW